LQAQLLIIYNQKKNVINIWGQHFPDSTNSLSFPVMCSSNSCKLFPNTDN